MKKKSVNKIYKAILSTTQVLSIFLKMKRNYYNKMNLCFLPTPLKITIKIRLMFRKFKTFRIIHIKPSFLPAEKGLLNPMVRLLQKNKKRSKKILKKK